MKNSPYLDRPLRPQDVAALARRVKIEERDGLFLIMVPSPVAAAGYIVQGEFRTREEALADLAIWQRWERERDADLKARGII